MARLFRILPFAFLILAGLRADVAPANLDPAVRPQDNFYRFADGGWLKRTTIPPDRARWAVFDELADRNLENLRIVCERATAENDQITASEQKVSDFYASGMDEGSIDAAGVTPLQFEFDRIEELKTSLDVLAELAHLNSLGVTAGFAFGSNPDFHDSRMEIAEVDQAGLGLPNRDYYFRTDEKSKKLREEYVAHVSRMFQLLGDAEPRARAEAEAVMRLETKLAGGSLNPVQLRDPALNYHKLNQSEAAALFPGIGWRVYFSKTDAPPFATFNLAQPQFFRVLSDALAQTPIAEWRAYLRWQFLHAYAPYLSDEFVQANFEFYGATLTGTKRLLPRWKRVVQTIDGEIGEALGQLYVADFFRPEAKMRAEKLVADLKSALRARLQTLEWMDEPTRRQALAKLDAMGVKIGYPEKWRDYSALLINRGPFVLNVLKANAFEVRRELRKIGKPVDRTEWVMSPPTVNAYYDPERNEIVFPAGILQPPFFSDQADDAANYGGIGTVIGHEMTHGFDDQGRKFDARGNLTDWWTPQSAARFKALAAAIVKQFNGYYVFPDLHLDGELTEGENIADLGGVKLAYAALERDLGSADRGQTGGYTPEQRFFLSYASIWAVHYRPEALRLMVATNPHAPGEYRVNGPLSNLTEFYAAFQVPKGAPMRRPAAERVTIW